MSGRWLRGITVGCGEATANWVRAEEEAGNRARGTRAISRSTRGDWERAAARGLNALRGSGKDCRVRRNRFWWDALRAFAGVRASSGRSENTARLRF